MPDSMDVLLAFLVLSGFAAAYFFHGAPIRADIRALDQLEGRSVVVSGFIRWVNGSRLGLCSGATCVSAQVRRGVEPEWAGRRAVVGGRYASGVLWVDAATGVDLTG